MKKVLLSLISIVCLAVIPFSAKAQERTDVQGPDKSLKVILRLHQLISSHNTIFKGGSIVLSRAVSHSVFLGVGAAYSFTKFHNDNNWDLTNLKFLPIFIDSKVLLHQDARIVPYLRFSSGISFVSYTKKELTTQREPYKVKETGLYMLSAVGCSFTINKFFTPVIEVGFKGFHMSFNQYDVNPHGVFLSLGLAF